jgi:hypothetical protein
MIEMECNPDMGDTILDSIIIVSPIEIIGIVPSPISSSFISMENVPSKDSTPAFTMGIRIVTTESGKGGMGE